MSEMESPLIDPTELAGRIDRVHLFDVRWRLGDPEGGREAYRSGHIPGAAFVDLDEDLSAPPGPAGRHPLPTPSDWAATLSRLGLTPGDEAVICDDAAGRTAARMWWMLRSSGHQSVRVLDGGVQAWAAEGHRLVKGEDEPEPATYPTPSGFSGTVEVSELGGRTVVDVREASRYRGLEEPIDPTPGHIPGAINLPSSLTVADRRLAGPDVLRSIYQGLDRPVMSCGSGVVACHSALAAVVAGLPMPDIYIGSYSEWSRSGRPISTGQEP